MAGKRKLIIQSVIGFGVVMLAAFVMGGVLGYLEAQGQDITSSAGALWAVGASPPSPC